MTELNVRPWMNDSPLTIGPKDNLRRALALLRSARVPELFVVDDGKLVGLLNEHDIWNRCPTGMIMLDEQQASELLEQFRVGGVMILQPPMVTPETSLREAIQLFAQTGRHGLPVMENGGLVGILTEERALQVIAAVLSEVEQCTFKK
ncbi:MAG: CBS domain-containing protein [Deltaproteobacteria bacterium]|nr:CBS domain-containing protein [Deltaproteobacteria bacterium]